MPIAAIPLVTQNDFPKMLFVWAEALTITEKGTANHIKSGRLWLFFKKTLYFCTS